jgi:spoIIIJ-associated protein
MVQVEKTGKTVDEAIELALKDLQTTAEHVKVEVLEEPTKGLLGILGSKHAKVRVSMKEINDEKTHGDSEDDFHDENLREVITVFLTDVLTEMGLDPQIDLVEEEECFFANVEGEGLGLLIGKRGQTLEAIQYITNIVANRHSSKRIRVIIDAEGYRKRREEVLQQLANRLAHRVERNGESVMLEPMTAHERKIIHTTLQNNPKVLTRSEGEEPNRKVIIQPNE